MSRGERVMITVNGRSAKALRAWLRLSPSSTPAGQATTPPREYREVPPDLDAKIGDMLKDGEEDGQVTVTYIRRPRKVSGHVRELILRCE